jgi:4-hydroxy-4-methyl-2-oxoglutarate aldolase
VAAGSVIVAALEADPDHAVFGGTFAALAKSRKLTGFVVDGAVLDPAALDRDVRSGDSIVPSRSSRRGGTSECGKRHLPKVGEVAVRPGDMVVADDDGVAVAPREHYAEILAAAEKWQSEKRALIPLIEKHGSYLKALRERNGGTKSQ